MKTCFGGMPFIDQKVGAVRVLLALMLALPMASEAQLQGIANSAMAGLLDIRTQVINTRTYGGNYDPVTTAALIRVQNEVDVDRVVIDRLIAQITGNTGPGADSVSLVAMRRLDERANEARDMAAAAQAQSENIMLGLLALALTKNSNQEAMDAAKRRVGALTRIRDLELLRERNLRDLSRAIAPVK